MMAEEKNTNIGKPLSRMHFTCIFVHIRKRLLLHGRWISERIEGGDTIIGTTIKARVQTSHYRT